jgi:hypothetical protein
VSLAASGLSVIADYPRLLIASTQWVREKGVVLENMYGWSGFYARTLGETGVLHRILTTASIGFTLAALIVLLRRGAIHASNPAFVPQMAVLICATLLMSLHLYRQDLTLMVVAIACCARSARQMGGSWGWWPALAMLIWLAQLYGPRLLFEHDVNVQTPALLLLFVASCLQAYRLERSAQHTQTERMLAA